MNGITTLQSRAWSCETLNRGAGLLENQNLPEDDLQAQITALEVGNLATFSLSSNFT
jgi:hypothetical protein